MRKARAKLTLNPGTGKRRVLVVNAVEAYMTSQSIDNDVDSFSVDLGDSALTEVGTLDRDTEVIVDLFLDDANGNWHQVFKGIADTVQEGVDNTLNIQGRDFASSIAMDSDALPGAWNNITPDSLIRSRALNLGIDKVRIQKMSPLTKRLTTDGSEKEWVFWYRIARMRDCYMWSDNFGGLIVDKLGYSLRSDYRFGVAPKGDHSTWIGVEDCNEVSTKQGRTRRVFFYGETGKKKATSSPIGAQGIDTTIRNWQKQPNTVLTSTTARTASALKKLADEEVFESIVGVQEITVVVAQQNILVDQNKMATVNLPQYGVVGTFFVVGVERSGGSAAPMIQTVRLREKNFALTKRVPKAPVIKADPATDKPAGSIGAALKQLGVRWGDAFAFAAREWGTANGWDTALFLGVLMAICEVETGFRNVRQDGDVEWVPIDQFSSADVEVNAHVPKETAYSNLFENEHSGHPGVGPMQLTYQKYKDWADQLGFGNGPKVGDLDGGRWFPMSNIRAAARALISAGKEHRPPIDPNNPKTIWWAIEKYHNSKNQSENVAYAAKVKAAYNNGIGSLSATGPEAATATASAVAVESGGAPFKFHIAGHGDVELRSNTPIAVRKALNFARAQLGDPYEHGGNGPDKWDCSGLAAASYNAGGPAVQQTLGGPGGGKLKWRETTYTLFKQGRFPAVARDKLLPGDAVFFAGADGTTESPGHMGIFIADGLFIEAPFTGEVVKYAALGDDKKSSGWAGARRIIPWFTPGVTDQGGDPSQPTTSSGKLKVVMIQAGHDTGEHGDQPYAHTGESGAPGEQAFTKSVRDAALSFFSSDSRFDAQKGTAWTPSAGATSDPSDDIYFNGDLFISIHYDAAGASGFFFGWPTGWSTKFRDNSIRLAGLITNRYRDVPGSPPLRSAGNNSTEALYGYYAYGHPSRSSPNDINRVPKAQTAILIECGNGVADNPWLNKNTTKIGKMLYQGVCDYYGFKPVGS